MWWFHDKIIEPSRRLQRDELKRVEKGKEDTGDFPDYRKPYEYYW
jgi:hypothetical protein